MRQALLSFSDFCALSTLWAESKEWKGDERTVVGYFEFSFLGSSSQTNMEYAAAERISSHHGCNRSGKKTHRAISNHRRQPVGILFTPLFPPSTVPRTPRGLPSPPRSTAGL